MWRQTLLPRHHLQKASLSSFHFCIGFKSMSPPFPLHTHTRGWGLGTKCRVSHVRMLRTTHPPSLSHFEWVCSPLTSPPERKMTALHPTKAHGARACGALQEALSYKVGNAICVGKSKGKNPASLSDLTRAPPCASTLLSLVTPSLKEARELWSSAYHVVT